MKIIVLIISLVNIWVFHRRVSRNRHEWDAQAKPPLPARMSAAVSISAWGSIIVFGRMIAYNWFDCDRPQPDWIIALAGCMAEYP